MRKKDRQQSREVALHIIAKAEYGVLSMSGPNESPYGIPVSPALVNNTIYVHCATEGYKLDVLAKNKQVCLTCVGYTCLQPSKFSTEYESAIAYGTAELVTDVQEKREALLAISEKYAPEYLKEAHLYIEKRLERTAIIKIEISKLTAKATFSVSQQGDRP